RYSANTRFVQLKSSLFSQNAICSRTDALFSQYAICSPEVMIVQLKRDLFTDEYVIQPICIFFTSNHECSAETRCVIGQLRYPTNKRFVQLKSSMFSQYAICSRPDALFSQYAICSAETKFVQLKRDLFTDACVIQPIRIFITKSH